MNKLKNILKNIIFSIPILRRISIAYITNQKILPSIFTRQDSDTLRRQLFLPDLEYETQLNQDIFALLVNQFKKGFFVEIGANDGFTLSNTVYLEHHFEWEGLLIEANPKYTKSLKQRKAQAVMLAIIDKEDNVDFRDAGLYGGVEATLDNSHPGKTDNCEVIKVSGNTLSCILEDYNAPNLVDFISIDVEGGELPIVRQMCELKKFRFKCGCIEHNFRSEDYDEMRSLLMQAGYQVFWEGQTQFDLFFIDSQYP